MALNNAGTPIAGVNDRPSAGVTRGTTPDIGAYEFTPVAVDVSPVALLSPGAMGGCYGPRRAGHRADSQQRHGRP